MKADVRGAVRGVPDRWSVGTCVRSLSADIRFRTGGHHDDERTGRRRCVRMVARSFFRLMGFDA